MIRARHAAMLALLWGIDANTETSEFWKLTSNLLSIMFWVITIILMHREWKEDA